MMEHMPRYARPHLEPPVDDAIEVFGNRLRLALIAPLRNEGPGTRGELSRRLEASEQTVANHLRALLQHRVINADPPPELHASGQRVAYAVNERAVRRLYAALGQGLHLS